ncbi:hypothetical protein CSOJ01_13897 [Colletotrichum sojae]|uniref:Uncharacterized protein n=1 Tax=Colletotrichum sojae TaxID=2175907 RepID=A0A8H6MKJ1_9PEZI|nr:hypothetical protein CSOJ01_13897 [Colletotrichum sojae]
MVCKRTKRNRGGSERQVGDLDGREGDTRGGKRPKVEGGRVGVRQESRFRTSAGQAKAWTDGASVTNLMMSCWVLVDPVSVTLLQLQLQLELQLPPQAVPAAMRPVD